MKILHNITTIILILIISLSKAANAKDKIVLASDDWCPYICNGQQDKPGFIVELTKQALALHGIEVEYKSMPLHKAIADASKGEIDGVLAIAKRKNDLIYPLQPQMYSHRKAYVRKGDYWHYDSPNSLEGRKLCAVLDYVMDSHTRRYFTKNYSLNPSAFVIEDGEDANITCITKVANGNADVYIADKNVVASYLHNSALGDVVKSVSVLGEHPQPLFVALSPHLKDAVKYAEKLVSAVESMRSIGDTKELAVKYGLCKNVDNCNDY